MDQQIFVFRWLLFFTKLNNRKWVTSFDKETKKELLLLTSYLFNPSLLLRLPQSQYCNAHGCPIPNLSPVLLLCSPFPRRLPSPTPRPLPFDLRARRHRLPAPRRCRRHQEGRRRPQGHLQRRGRRHPRPGRRWLVNFVARFLLFPIYFRVGGASGKAGE